MRQQGRREEEDVRLLVREEGEGELTWNIHIINT